MTMFAFGKRSCADLIEQRKVYWFIEPESPLMPLGFIRDGGGAFVIGGKTGSHFTGHAETWWDKLLLIGSLGYIPVELAMKRGVIPDDWTPPKPSEKDAVTLNRIQKEELRGVITPVI